MCYRISDMGLCKVQKGHTYTLDEFREVQFAQLEEVSLSKFHFYEHKNAMSFMLFHMFLHKICHEFTALLPTFIILVGLLENYSVFSILRRYAIWFF